MTAPPSSFPPTAVSAPPGGPGAPGIDSAAGQLLQTFSLLRRVMRPRFSNMGISFPQWGVLNALYDCGPGRSPALRLTDLADRLMVRPPSVTAAVDRLQRGGLVARDSSPADRRVTRVRLTSRGRRLVEKVHAGHLAHVDRLLGGLSGAEHAQLHRLLHSVSGHLERALKQENTQPSVNPKLSKLRSRDSI
jgi:DNA-binding MarR family transcriptional regulator